MVGTVEVKKPRTLKQYAALPWRFAGNGCEVALITSRDTGRWVIPKGWPIRGLSPAKSAAREAFEEAGFGGKVSREPLGTYVYNKKLRNGSLEKVKVRVFAMEHLVQHPDWPERGQRQLRWFSPSDAAAYVAEPALREVILKLQPQ